MTSNTRTLVLLLLATTGCSAVVTAGDAAPVSDASPVTDATPVADAAPPPTPDSPPCEAVRASCGPLPQQVVRGRAEGLVGLDGGRARFAIRYNRDGVGGVRTDGVVSAWATVAGGAFEACVCLPRGGNEYPMVAALVYAPGSAGESSRGVVRAMASQRFATLGDEQLAAGLTETPPAAVIETAVAAMEDRTAEVTARGFDGALEGAMVFAGLVANERPVAAQIAVASVTGGDARLAWVVPGRAWPSERLVLLVDRNRDRLCDPGDLGGAVSLGERASITVPTLVTGAALEPLCASLALGAPREL
jgi:hypothetical protein